MMRLFKDTFECVGEDCQFPKFHATLHYIQQIKRFGGLRLLDSGVGERQHKVWVQPPFLSNFGRHKFLRRIKSRKHIGSPPG